MPHQSLGSNSYSRSGDSVLIRPALSDRVKAIRDAHWDLTLLVRSLSAASIAGSIVSMA